MKLGLIWASSALFALFGCAGVSAESRHGNWAVSGLSTDPGGTAMALSSADATTVYADTNAYVMTRQADTYAYCLKYGCGGGYYGYATGPYSDACRLYNYGCTGAVNPQSGYASQADLERVEEKANDSLRMHARVREYLKKQATQK